MSEWIKKQDSTICCLQETHFKNNNTYSLKVNRLRKIYHTDTNQKKAGVAALISETANFKATKNFRGKEEHYIMIKGPVLQEDITILSVYVPT